jgi:isoleucyl-tRNA synthetase
VHLADFPVADEGLIDGELNENMKLARFIVSVGLQTRSEQKIKVRQPLKSVIARFIDVELQEIVKEELNVKEYIVDSDKEYKGSFNILDLTITPELRLEGEAREIVRAIQEGRKKAGFNVEDRIVLGYTGKEKVFALFGEMIAKEVLATEYSEDDLKDFEYSEEVNIEGEVFRFWLKRV